MLVYVIETACSGLGATAVGLAFGTQTIEVFTIYIAGEWIRLVALTHFAAATCARAGSLLASCPVSSIEGWESATNEAGKFYAADRRAARANWDGCAALNLIAGLAGVKSFSDMIALIGGTIIVANKAAGGVVGCEGTAASAGRR